MCRFAKLYASVCNTNSPNSPSLVASLFSWRYLAASTSSSLHASMNLRPSSVTASAERRRFPILRYAKRPDIALYAVGPLFRLPTLSSPHCTLKVSEHDSLWQPRTMLFLQELPIVDILKTKQAHAVVLKHSTVLLGSSERSSQYNDIPQSRRAFKSKYTLPGLNTRRRMPD